MKKLTPADRLDAVLMQCPMEELPALIDRAMVIAKARGMAPAKKPRKAKNEVQLSGMESK